MFLKEDKKEKGLALVGSNHDPDEKKAILAITNGKQHKMQKVTFRFVIRYLQNVACAKQYLNVHDL